MGAAQNRKVQGGRTRRIGIGVIGCGSGWNAVYGGMSDMADGLFELVAFCDIIPERVQNACMEFGAPGAKAYLDYRELVANPDVEVLSLHTTRIPPEDLAAAAMDTNRCISPTPPKSPGFQAFHNAWAEGTGKQIYYVIQPGQGKAFR